MLKGLEGWHIVILALLLIALFGAKRLPDAARSLGRSMRVFKSEMDGMKSDGKSPASSATVPGETVPPATSTSPVSEKVPPADDQAGHSA